MATEKQFDYKSLWESEESALILDKILAGERLANSEEEDDYISALLDNCSYILGRGDFGFAVGSQYDLAVKTFEILARTPAGRDFINKRESEQTNGVQTTRRLLNSLLENTFGELNESRLYNAEIMRTALCVLADDPAVSDFDPRVTREVRDFVLAEGRVDRIFSLIDDGSLAPNIDQETLDSVRQKFATKKIEPITGLPYLSDEALLEQVGLLAESAEKEARKHRLFQDATVLAQMEWNAIMRDQVDLTERTILQKIQDKIKYGITDLGNPITYPSESIFSHSLSRLDSNGRVVETYLNFRRGLIGPRVEFPRAEVPEHVYDLAALNVRMKGVAKPHINTTFRNPQQAIMFMERSVDSLVKAGYDINDISVAPHLQVAFEAHKQKHMPQFTITDAAEPDYINPKPSPERVPLMPEEFLQQKNVEINGPLEPITAKIKAIEDGGNDIKLSDFSQEQLHDVMSAYIASGNDEKVWQQIFQDAGYTPISWETVKKIHAEVEKLFNKFEKNHVNYDPGSVGNSEIKLLQGLGVVVLQDLLGVDRFGSAYNEILQRSIQYDKDMAALQVHNQPDNLPDAEHDDISETRGLAMSEEDGYEPFEKVSDVIVHDMHEPISTEPIVSDSSSPAVEGGIETIPPYMQVSESELSSIMTADDVAPVTQEHDFNFEGFENIEYPEATQSSFEEPWALRLAEMELPNEADSTADAPSVSEDDAVLQVPGNGNEPSQDSVVTVDNSDHRGSEPWTALPGTSSQLEIPPQTNPDLGPWSTLSREKQVYFSEQQWSELPLEDVRWVLGLSDTDVHQMKKGNGANWGSIRVADTFETLRDFLCPFQLNYSYENLTQSQRDLIKRLPMDIIENTSEQMQGIRKKIDSELGGGASLQQNSPRMR